MSLTTVQQVRQFTSITTDDSFFDILLPAVEAAVKNYLDRDIESTPYVDFYDTNGSSILLLNEYPVTSLSEIKEDATGYYGTVSGSFGSTTVLASGIDYALVKDGRNSLAEVGRVARLNGVWPCRWTRVGGLLTAARKPALGAVKVTYVAGYAANAIPKDIQQAIWLMCARVRQMRKRGFPQASESLAEYSYSNQSIQQALQMGEVSQLLSRWRRLRQRHKVLS